MATPRPLIQPNAQSQYEVTAEDLPLSCPMPEMYLWNSHPRVYLPIEETGWSSKTGCQLSPPFVDFHTPLAAPAK